jgi:DNA-binding NarL/FixJ family response regulator
MTNKEVSVVICDDHQMVREALANVLNAQGINVVGSVDTEKALLAVLGDTQTDVLLLDIALNNESGLDILRRVRLSHPGTAVVMLTSFRSASSFVASYQAGASAFVLKSGDSSLLVKTIIDVSMGLNLFNREALEELSLRGLDLLGTLDEFDRAILRLLGTGASDQQIAEAVHLNLQTVRNRVSRMLKKFGYENRTQLALFVSQVADELR